MALHTSYRLRCHRPIYHILEMTMTISFLLFIAASILVIQHTSFMKFGECKLCRLRCSVLRMNALQHNCNQRAEVDMLRVAYAVQILFPSATLTRYYCLVESDKLNLLYTTMRDYMYNVLAWFRVSCEKTTTEKESSTRYFASAQKLTPTYICEGVKFRMIRKVTSVDYHGFTMRHDSILAGARRIELSVRELIVFEQKSA